VRIDALTLLPGREFRLKCARFDRSWRVPIVIAWHGQAGWQLAIANTQNLRHALHLARETQKCCIAREDYVIWPSRENVLYESKPSPIGVSKAVRSSQGIPIDPARDPPTGQITERPTERPVGQMNVAEMQ
jgi:hypothetical protein